MAFFLDFEKKIQQLQEEIELGKVRKDLHAVEILEKELEKEVVKTYKNLTDYQKLQLARHQDRPYALDYINLIMTDHYEIHGDRHFRDDPSIVCFIGKIGEIKCVVIGEEKGRGTKNKILRNFGMPHPEGYRKALRAAKMAEKFNLPVLMLIDTPGAYPGLGAEERGQSEAIARNLLELSQLKTPTVSVVIGEGGSGGAIAVAAANRILMLEHSIYSVISPEGCASILWRSADKVKEATEALKLTAQDLKALGVIDEIIEEPIGGAHRNTTLTIDKVGATILKHLKELLPLSGKELKKQRTEKFLAMGRKLPESL